MVDVCLGVIRDPFLEEIRFALQGDHVHEIEWIRDIVALIIAKGDKEAVGDEFDVLAHQLRIHANKSDGESIWISSVSE